MKEFSEEFGERIKQPKNPELLEVIKQLSSVTIHNLDRLNNLDEIRSLVIVGSSGTGKSTLVDELRRVFEFCKPAVSFPQRLITRPKRDNDNMKENIHTTAEEMANEVEFADDPFYTIDPDSMSQHRMRKDLHRKREFIHWKRIMEKDRITDYAFEAPSIYYQIKVLSANNAFGEEEYNNAKATDTLWIGITASETDREARLARRSPDMGEDERKKRLGDLSENVTQYSDLTIANTDSNPEVALNDIKRLFTVLAKQALERYSKMSPFRELASEIALAEGGDVDLEEKTKWLINNLKENDFESYQKMLDIIKMRKKKYEDFLIWEKENFT